MAIFEFIVFYLREVVISNLRVAYDVLTPRHHMKPGLIEIPIEGMSQRQILALANLITMTPGTLSLDVSPERKCLLVHSMYLTDPEADVREIVNSFNRRIARVF